MKEGFEAGKDLVITVMSAMGEEQIWPSRTSASPPKGDEKRHLEGVKSIPKAEAGSMSRFSGKGTHLHGVHPVVAVQLCPDVLAHVACNFGVIGGFWSSFRYSCPVFKVDGRLALALRCILSAWASGGHCQMNFQHSKPLF